MSDPTPSRASFSPASRWRIALDVALRTLLVVAVFAAATRGLAERTTQAAGTR